MSSETHASTTLAEALAKHSISLPDEQVELIDQYCHLLWEWNAKLNLTRHLDYDTFVARDVIDSMQLASCLSDRERVLDFGSGGGVPGMLIGILRPRVRLTLADSIEKKASALSDMVERLGLSTKVVASRVQDLLPKKRFETIVARAVGPTAKVLKWVEPHWNYFGRMLLIKGPRWVEERKEARHLGLMAQTNLRCLKSYPMPGTESESVILCFTRKG